MPSYFLKSTLLISVFDNIKYDSLIKYKTLLQKEIFIFDEVQTCTPSTPEISMF